MFHSWAFVAYYLICCSTSGFWLTAQVDPQCDRSISLALSTKAKETSRCQTLEYMWKYVDSRPQPCTPADAPAPKASEEATKIPAEHAWRCKVRTAVRETMAEILDRANDSGETLEMYPIHGKLPSMEHRLLTDPNLDKKDAHEVLRLGRMFLYLCDLESDDDVADDEVAEHEVDSEVFTVSAVEV